MLINSENNIEKKDINCVFKKCMNEIKIWIIIKVILYFLREIILFENIMTHSIENFCILNILMPMLCDALCTSDKLLFVLFLV